MFFRSKPTEKIDAAIIPYKTSFKLIPKPQKKEIIKKIKNIFKNKKEIFFLFWFLSRGW
jgi:hypothetical protein